MKTSASLQSAPAAQQYPVLKRSNFNPEFDYVVLFTAPDVGFVVHVFATLDDMVKVGWNGKCDSGDGFREEGFIPFDGSITLSNY